MLLQLYTLKIRPKRWNTEALPLSVALAVGWGLLDLVHPSDLEGAGPFLVCFNASISFLIMAIWASMVREGGGGKISV